MPAPVCCSPRAGVVLYNCAAPLPPPAAIAPVSRASGQCAGGRQLAVHVHLERRLEVHLELLLHLALELENSANNPQQLCWNNLARVGPCLQAFCPEPEEVRFEHVEEDQSFLRRWQVQAYAGGVDEGDEVLVASRRGAAGPRGAAGSRAQRKMRTMGTMEPTGPTKPPEPMESDAPPCGAFFSDSPLGRAGSGRARQHAVGGNIALLHRSQCNSAP
eukprot:gene5520-biopygen1167